MDNFILIGMPGTGKSTVGVVLAKLLGFNFIDTDILISNKDKASRPLRQIIAQDGYEAFLKAEGQIGEDLCCSHSVIATGGSMVYSEKAMENLARLGLIVWLDTPVSVIEDRIGGDLQERGVATPGKMTVAEIYEDRERLYSRWAQLRFPCAGSTEQVVTKLRDQLLNCKLHN